MAVSDLFATKNPGYFVFLCAETVHFANASWFHMVANLRPMRYDASIMRPWFGRSRHAEIDHSNSLL